MSIEDKNNKSEFDSSIGGKIDIDKYPDAVLLADIDTRKIVQVNKEAASMLDSEPSDLVGLYQWEIHPKGSKEKYEEAFERGLKGERVNRLENGEPIYVESTNGVLTPVEINVTLIKKENLIMGVFRDVTEQIQREQKIKSVNESLNKLISTVPLPVCSVNTNGEIKIWNKSAESVYGYEKNEVIGQKYPLLLDDQEFSRLFEKIIDQGDHIESYETTHITADGRRIPVEMYGSPIIAQNGDIEGAIGVSIDLTSRKRRTRHLNILNRVLRHNLRNKLSVIKGWADSVNKEDLDTEALCKIQDATESLIKISNEVDDLRNSVNHHKEETTRRVNMFKILQSIDTQNELDLSNLNRDLKVEEKIADSIVRIVRKVDSSKNIGKMELYSNNKSNLTELSINSNNKLFTEGEAFFLETGSETELKHASGIKLAHSYLTITEYGGKINLDQDRTCINVKVPNNS